MTKKLYNTDVISIFGQRGSGKTIMAKYLLSKYPKYFIYDSLGEYSKFGRVVFDLDDIDREQDEKIVFNPIYTDNNQETHDKVSQYIWDYLPHYLFVTDEMHIYQNKNLSKNFMKMITQGRHHGNALMSITQRFANVNQTITTQSNKLFVFNLFGRDIETARGYFGKEISEKIKKLKKYSYLYWDTSNADFSINKPLPTKIVKKLI